MTGCPIELRDSLRGGPSLLFHLLNFLLHESLGGGGTLSLLLDGQGKTFAQFLLATDVEVDSALLEA